MNHAAIQKANSLLDRLNQIRISEAKKMITKKCPFCNEKVDWQKVDNGDWIFYDHATRNPHVHDALLADGDRCPSCKERVQDFSRHLCKR
jgi:hypothetical protein